ncbi:MAG: aminotransferase class V-fold PLP-dependent enzyme [Gemmatimonadaceae bacterium]
MDKREFLKTAAGASLGFVLSESLLARMAAASPAELAEDDAFWTALRGKYRLKPDFINLENGYYSMQSQEVLEKFIGRVRELNYQASYYMRTTMAPDKTAVATRLAALAGCGADELIITRNTTESLDTVISGYDWKAGDEIIMAQQDYGAMRDMFQLMARRYGIVPVDVSVPMHPSSDDEVVQTYAKVITPKTRLLMCCHMVNITGHILPVKKIAAMAKARSVDVMVDGAHAFAQLDYRIADFGVDYYGASLHKWLGAPLGAGILYVRKDKIPSLWPVFADASMPDNDIRKLNHTGTHPAHTDLAIHDAIDFHNAIGIQRKEARLRFLQRYWTDQVRDVKNIELNTPKDLERSCAIANVGITNMLPGDLSKTLLDKYKIWTVAINGAGVKGARITPQLFTTTKELDAFVSALKEMAKA